jgi:hypothetical protein
VNDLEALFEKIRKLPAGRRKQIRDYAEYVASGCSRKDRRCALGDDLEAVMKALEKENRVRRVVP